MIPNVLWDKMSMQICLYIFNPTKYKEKHPVGWWWTMFVKDTHQIFEISNCDNQIFVVVIWLLWWCDITAKMKISLAFNRNHICIVYPAMAIGYQMPHLHEIRFVPSRREKSRGTRCVKYLSLPNWYKTYSVSLVLQYLCKCRLEWLSGCRANRMCWTCRQYC